MRTRFVSNVSAGIQASAGIAAVLLGLTVIIGWQTGSPLLTQVRPGLPAMQYVNALAFVIAGVGLLSAGSGRDDVAGIAGLLIGAVGLLSLAQDVLNVDAGVDLVFGVTTYLISGAAMPARMSSPAAICFTLAGAGLFLRRLGGAARTSILTSFLGATTAALGLVCLLAHATQLATNYGWGRLSSMALHTAVGLFMVGAGLAARGWRDSPIVSATRLPALVGVASLTASIAVWHALATHDRDRTFQLIQTHAAYLRSAIAVPLESEARALEQLAHRASLASGVPDAWMAEAALRLEDFDGIYAVERVDFRSGAAWTVPSGFRPSDGLAESRERAVSNARKTRGRAIGNASVTADPSPGLVVAAPILESGAVSGVAVGFVDYEKLVGRALAGQGEGGYELAILDGVRQIYGNTRPGRGGGTWTTEVDLGLRGAQLRLRVWPTPVRLAQLEGRLPSLMLVGGLLLSAVLTSMTYFAGMSRRRERQLRQVAEELRASEQRYRKARDAALESDRLKSEFVANVSHELRTPLNGILGLTELMLETDLTPEQREHAATVRECGETLLVLLNDILDLSKVEAGKLEIQSLPFEPRRLVQQTADLFAERARRKGVNLVCLVHHDVSDVVVADPGRVRQVLTNLLGNAVKFTEAGEITVRVSQSGSLHDGFALRVDVTDTGIGITPEAARQIFQPFVQADGSITRRFGGTGLGLVISKQLVELMGGKMSMTSQLGEGSTFWFTVRTTAPSLPNWYYPPQAFERNRPAEGVERPVSKQEKRGTGSVAAQAGSVPVREALTGLRVLLLDDSASGRRRWRELLEAGSLSVTESGTTDESLDLLKAAVERGEPFDAVLATLRQPGTSVLDFAAAAHAAGVVPRSKLILMSGRGEPGDAQRAQSLGAAAYLTNPISDSCLLDCLATVFGNASDGPAAAINPTPLVTRYTIERQKHPMKDLLLVVEDNPVNQKVMVGFLHKLGYRADIANNGIEALQALQRTPYRLVFMDSQMPGMDGFATTGEIRRLEAPARRTIIVCVTAHAMKDERERCLAAGMDDYISKPVSLERLAIVLEKWLAPSGADEPAAVLHRDIQRHAGGKSPIDSEILGALRELEADTPGLLADVVSTFLRETPGRIERIRGAHHSVNGAALEGAAHALKGSAAAIGAQRLAQVCDQIEGCARRAALNECSASVAALEAMFDEARDVLLREDLAMVDRHQA